MYATDPNSPETRGVTRLLSTTGLGRAAHMGGGVHLKFPTYGAVVNLNFGRWVAFSEFLP